MFVRKWTEAHEKEMADGELVLTGSKNVNIRDGKGNYNEIRIGMKYIVSGADIVMEFFESTDPIKPKPRAVKPEGKEVKDGS